MSKDNKQLTSKINAAKEVLWKTIINATRTGHGTYSDLAMATMHLSEAYGILKCLDTLKLVSKSEADYYYGELKAVDKLLTEIRRKQEVEVISRHLTGGES